jgi:DNA transformation protein and related proteins
LSRSKTSTKTRASRASSDRHRFDDLFLEFGPITLRRFFGGEGIYAGSLMIAMVFADTIYFKTDDKTIGAFRKEGSLPFTFKKRGSEIIETTWFSLPDRLYDDPEELAHWARDALQAAKASPQAVVKARKRAEAKSPRRERPQRQRKRARLRTPG